MFHIIALLDFESLDAFKAAATAHGKEVLGDIPTSPTFSRRSSSTTGWPDGSPG